MRTIARVSISATTILMFTSLVAATDLPTAPPEEIGLSQERLNVLSSVIEDAVAAGDCPGAVVLVARHGKVGFLKSFGVLDPATKEPMPEDAIFRIYSMSKALSAVPALSLVEHGKMTLSTRVSDVLPEFSSMMVADLSKYNAYNDLPRVRPAANPIVVVDLLKLSGGFVDYNFYPNFPREMFRKAGIASQALTLKQAAAVAAKAPLLYEPGTTFSYAETNYDVLGQMLQVIEDKPIAEVCEEHFFAPNGMSDTGFERSAEQVTRLAQPLTEGPKASLPLFDATKPRAFHSAANGLLSSAQDYFRFAQMLLDGGRSLDGTVVLSTATAKTMLTGQSSEVASGSVDFMTEYMPSFDFGLGLGIRTSQAGGYVLGGAQLASWGGHAGTYFVIDRDRERVGVFMRQCAGDFALITLIQTLLLQTAAD